MVKHMKKAFNNQNKRPIAIVALAIVIIAIIFIVFYLHYRSMHVATDDAFVEGKIHIIASKVNGTVKIIHVYDNQFVKKDDLLLEIDPVDYDVKVREITSAYEAEQAKSSETQDWMFHANRRSR